MRVALDATPMIGTRTGIGLFVAELRGAMQAMRARGADVEVAAYTLSVRARLRGETQGVWVPLPASRAPTVWRWFKGPRIETFIRKVDVVHGTNYLVPPSTHPRVVTVHDLSFLHDSGAAPAAIARFDRAVADAVNSGAVVHTISNYVAEEIRDRYRAPDVRVVYPGVHSRRPKAQEKDHRPVLLALGATQRRKGLPDLVKAFELIGRVNKDVELHIVGPAGDDEDRVNRAVRQLPDAVATRVRRIGFVGEEERDRRVAHASVLVHASHYEGFGFPLVEAMASDTPVVSTSGGAIPEIVEDAALMVEPGDVRALAGAVIQVMEDQETREQLIRVGRERAARFRWADTADGIVDIYRSFS